MNFRRAAVFVLVFAGAASTGLSACSDAGEGERCEVDNGTGDCQAGLVCIPARQRQGATRIVNPPFNTVDRCCPPDPKAATHPACTLAQTPVGDADTNLDADTEPDAPTDAGADADASDAREAGDASDADAQDAPASG